MEVSFFGSLCYIFKIVLLCRKFPFVRTHYEQFQHNSFYFVIKILYVGTTAWPAKLLKRIDAIPISNLNEWNARNYNWT